MDRVQAPQGLAEYRAGARVCGRYVVSRRVRGDAFFSVYVAHLADARDKLATVWQFHRAFGGSVAAFQREMTRVRGALEHRALARVLAFGIEPNGPVVVTARPFDTTLADVLSRAEPLRPNEVGFFMSEIASALDHLHAQTPTVLHSMIGPECVLVAARSGPVWLDGAGILGALAAAGWLDDHDVFASPTAYLSPGVLLDSVDRHGDLFTLASLTFECLTGRKAFEGSDEAQVRGAIVKGVPTADAGTLVSGPVRAALDRAWSPRRAEAFESATDFALSLSRELVSAPEVRVGKSTLQHLAPVATSTSVTVPNMAAVPPEALRAPESMTVRRPEAPLSPIPRATPPVADSQTERDVDQAFDELFKPRNTASFGVVLAPADRTGPNRAIAASVVQVGSDPPKKLSTPTTAVGRGLEPEPVIPSEPPAEMPSAEGTQPMYAHVEELLTALATLDPTRASPPASETEPGLPLGAPEEPPRLTPVPSVKPLPAPVPAQADVTARYSPLPALAALNLVQSAPVVTIKGSDRASPAASPVPAAPAAPVASVAPAVPAPSAAPAVPAASAVPAVETVVTPAPQAQPAPTESSAPRVATRSVARSEVILALRGFPRRSRRRTKPAPSASPVVQTPPAAPIAAVPPPAPAPAPTFTTPRDTLPSSDGAASAQVARMALMLSMAIFLVGVVHTLGGVYKARVERETESLRAAHAAPAVQPLAVAPPIAVADVVVPPGPPSPPPAAAAPPPAVAPPAPTPTPTPTPVAAPEPPALVEPPPAVPTPAARPRRPPLPTADSITEAEIRVARAVTPCVRGISSGRHLRFDVRYSGNGNVTAVRVLGLFAHPPFMQCIISAAARERMAPFATATWVHPYAFMTGTVPVTPVRPNAP